MNTFIAGDKVRFNVPDEAEYGQIGTVIGSQVSRIDDTVSYWISMPFGHAWLYRPEELAEAPDENYIYTLAVGAGFAIGTVFSTRDKAESEAKRLKLKYYEVIPYKITRNA